MQEIAEAEKTAAGRARPLAVEDRQAMIIDAVIPLLLERGSAVTTKQIAEATGLAEGTIFRAFGDKETLISAAVTRHMDPTPLRRELGRIDANLPLEEKVRTILVMLQARFSGIFRLMTALDQSERPRPTNRRVRSEYAAIVAGVLEPDLERLNLPAERVAPLIRLVAFSTSVPPLNESTPFTLDELTGFVLYGIAGRSASEKE